MLTVIFWVWVAVTLLSALVLLASCVVSGRNR